MYLGPDLLMSIIYQGGVNLVVKFDKSIYSALYNYLDGMFTSADQGDTFQISRLDRDTNEDEIGIENIEAL